MAEYRGRLCQGVDAPLGLWILPERRDEPLFLVPQSIGLADLLKGAIGQEVVARVETGRGRAWLLVEWGVEGKDGSIAAR